MHPALLQANSNQFGTLNLSVERSKRGARKHHSLGPQPLPSNYRVPSNGFEFMTRTRLGMRHQPEGGEQVEAAEGGLFALDRRAFKIYAPPDEAHGRAESSPGGCAARARPLRAGRSSSSKGLDWMERAEEAWSRANGCCLIRWKWRREETLVEWRGRWIWVLQVEPSKEVEFVGRRCCPSGHYDSRDT